jgi:hypothetical protein
MKSDTLLLLVILFFILSGSKFNELFANTANTPCSEIDSICALWKSAGRIHVDCNMSTAKAFKCRERPNR